VIEVSGFLPWRARNFDIWREHVGAEERAAKIERYGGAYAQLARALERFPREMWTFKSPADPWSIQEIVIHITDSEANSFVRCRRFIAEPGEAVMAYDENQWASALRYSEQSADDALELFRMLRLTTYKLVKSLPAHIWSNTVYHPENGTMTLDDWLNVYERHIPEHVEQMQRVYQAWLNRA
jgi:hypothetical protein